MSTDNRVSIYHDVLHRELSEQDAQTRAAASKILNILREYVAPRSILDVGCGIGSWLATAQRLGIDDVHGVEGGWLDRGRLVVDGRFVSEHDLEQGLDLERRFDLTISMEVAEHLFERAAERFVDSLVRHSDIVLFSAAIPFQGGQHHVNERFPDYWAAIFAAKGFVPLDIVRPRLWFDTDVVWWLRQNTLVFAHERVLAENERLRLERAIPRPLSVVHPDFYLMRQDAIRHVDEEHRRLIEILSQGGTFRVDLSPERGGLNITRV